MDKNFKHILSMVDPITGHREYYSFDHSILVQLVWIVRVWSPLGYYGFLIDGKPIAYYRKLLADQKEVE